VNNFASAAAHIMVKQRTAQYDSLNKGNLYDGEQVFSLGDLGCKWQLLQQTFCIFFYGFMLLLGSEGLCSCWNYSGKAVEPTIPENEDRLVRRERERQETDDVLRVSQLVKRYTDEMPDNAVRTENDDFSGTTQGCLAVKGVSFGVKENEVFTILGASGAGKSTVVKCLVDIEPQSSGKVFLGGKELRVQGLQHKLEGKVGFCPQVDCSEEILTVR